MGDSCRNGLFVGCIEVVLWFNGMFGWWMGVFLGVSFGGVELCLKNKCVYEVAFKGVRLWV